ncbi:MAG: PQQ-dependent sugar dehydrogenase [Pseudomonadales bacterium]
MNQRCRLWIVTLLVVAGCGGGGSNDGNLPPVNQPPADPFGLDAREPVAALAIPLGSGTLGTYELVNAFPALSFPAAVFLTAVPGENRLVVVQQSGQVQAFADQPGTNTSRLVLDVSGRISFGGEKGLLGFAFDPDFAQNRYLYVYQSMASTASPGVEHVSRVSRFTWNAGTDSVALASEKVILEVDQPYSNHNGGMLAFGPDDHLYVGLGDGGSGDDPQNNAQTTTNLLGSLLRIDVHPADPADGYDIPPDNPFLGQAGFRGEIWAYGLRNPWRFSFDRGTGALWAGDVGQVSREEIDIIVRGGNYGWRIYEGNLSHINPANRPPTDFEAPVIDYDRGQGSVVIGGYVYRGSAVPSLQGRYLYADAGSGNVWALRYDAATGTVLENELIENRGGITSFGEDASGDVHAVTGGGSVLRFEALGGGTPSDPPALLSDTGVFDDLATLTPASGFIEYDLNAPFWSDGTVKRRWIAVPDGDRIGFSSTSAWTFPVGTVIVKHFELALTEGDPGSQRRLETRLLVRRSDGWRGFTYRWNAAETEATLLSQRQQETITVELAAGGTRDQLYEYPSRTDCLGCHTEAAGFVLGARTRQLNRAFDYPAATDNQLRAWNHIDLFSTDIGSASGYSAYPDMADTSVAVETRARTYLDVNCAQCHQPGGPAPTAMDLRYDTATAAMGIVDVAPSAGDLGIADARIVASGDRARSVLWQRLRVLDANRMPSVGSHVVDEAGVELIGDWIDGL